MKILNRVALIFSILISASMANAAPQYEVIVLGPTNMQAHFPPSAIWKLNNNDETVLGNLYVSVGSDITYQLLPVNAAEAKGPTENGYVHVKIGNSYFWWNHLDRSFLPAPSGITSMSGNGWTTRGEEVGSHPRIVAFPPMSASGFQIYTDSSCDTMYATCLVTTEGVSNGGDAASSWSNSDFESTTYAYRMNSAQIANSCGIGPVNNAGSFLYATDCNGNSRTWNLNVGGALPSPQDGAPVWTAMNDNNQIVGYVSGQSGTRALLSFNSTLTDLNDSVSSTYHIDAAYAINDHGSILAVGTLLNEPSTPLALLLREAPFVVNTVEDGSDAHPGDGVCATSSGNTCSLRAAIEEANTSPGISTISFNISGSTEPVINLRRELPYLTQPVRILGNTQPVTKRVSINGAAAESTATGLSFTKSGNELNGVRIYGFGLNGINLILGGQTVIRNTILGIAPDGANSGFGAYGIFISESSDNQIGGDNENRNVIANAGISGISIDGNSVRNEILSNAIFGNSSLGIDLGDNGATANHGIGFASGANNFQNFPVLTGYAVNSGIATIDGTLTAESNKMFIVQLFASECSGSRGQGQELLDSTVVRTGLNGQASFQFVVPSGMGAVTATATDQDGNTSEFSPIKVSPDALGGACTTSLNIASKTSYYQKGKGKLSFKCPGQGTCKGILLLKYKKTNKKSFNDRALSLITIAKAAFQSKASGAVTVNYTLNKQGVQLMNQKHGKVPATAVVTITSKNGSRGATTFGVTIKKK